MSESRGVRGRSGVRVAAGEWMRGLPRVTVWYLGLIWLVFLVVAAIDFEGRREFVDPLGYSIEDLRSNLPKTMVVLPTAVFINVGVLQILYVTAILVAVSPRLVSRDGAPVTAAVFLGATVIAGVVAGLALHLAGDRIDHAIVDEAWERRWNGGSAGCYGLLGLLAAGTRRPWLTLGLVGAWEIGLAVTQLRSYTPAFHVTALLAGFCVGRWRQRSRMVGATLS